MKFVSFEKDGIPSFGVLRGKSIRDVGALLGPECPDLKAFLTLGIDRLPDLNSTPLYSLDEVNLLPVIPNPGAIWCAGLNTYSHFSEVKAFLGDKERPQQPMFFLRATGTLVASGQALEKPRTEPAFDYEGEVAVIIGKKCRNVTEEQALDYVAGYTCFNDATARLYQKNSEQMTTGKNAWRSGGFGPCMATEDSIVLESIELKTRVNGQLRQTMKMDDLIFSVNYLISHISEVYELQPGDVIVTGSPAGIGAAMDPREFLQPGDVVEVEVSDIGTLVNEVISQSA